VKLKNETLLFEAYCFIEWIERLSKKDYDITNREIGWGTEAAYRELLQSNIVESITIPANDSRYAPRYLYSLYFTPRGAMVLKGLERKFKSLTESPSFESFWPIEYPYKRYLIRPVTTTNLPVLVKNYKQLREAINEL
jgi:hypothetical protein